MGRFKILMIIPVKNASYERSLSKLKVIKHNYD